MRLRKYLYLLLPAGCERVALFCPSDSSPGADDPYGRCGPRRRNTMDNDSTSERVSDADLTEGIKVIDVDTHISEPLDLWTSRATPKYRDRVPQMRMLDGKWVWTIDGDRSMGVGSAVERDLPRRQQGGRNRVHRLAGRRGAPGMLADEGASRVHGRERHLGPDRLSERPGVRGPGAGAHGRAATRAGRRRPAPGQHADLQRRHGRDAGGVGRPPPADGSAALVGHRPGRRRRRSAATPWGCGASTSTPTRSSTGCRT